MRACMNARVHTDRSIDRSNRLNRYAWFNRNQPTNQPTSRTNDRSIPPIRSVHVVQSTPTSRTNDRSIRSVPHRSHHHSYGSKVEASRHGSIEPREHRSDRYEGFNRSIDRSIDTDRPTARDTRPSGSGIHPSASRRRRHTRARTSGRRRPTRSRGLREHRLNLIQGNSWRKDRRATRRKNDRTTGRCDNRHGGGRETLEGNSIVRSTT